MRVSSVWRCSLIARVVFIWNSGFVFIAGLIMLGFHGFVLVFCLCSVGVILSAGFFELLLWWVLDSGWALDMLVSVIWLVIVCIWLSFKMITTAWLFWGGFVPVCWCSICSWEFVHDERCGFSWLVMSVMWKSSLWARGILCGERPEWNNCEKLNHMVCEGHWQ